ncbi:unnamed protein product, partial [Closterium sp. Naga37s-1]
MVPKSDSATAVPHVRRWLSHHWLPSPAAAAPSPCQRPSPSRQHPSTTSTTLPCSNSCCRGAEATTLEGRREVTGGADDRSAKAAAANSQLASLHASPTRPSVPLLFNSRLGSPSLEADEPHAATSLASPALLVPPMPLAIRVEATGGMTCQVAGEGNTSGRSTASAASASCAEWSPPRGARTAREVRGGNARRPAGAAAEGRGRSGASSEDEARSDDERRLSENSPAHAADTAAPAPSLRHAHSSPSRVVTTPVAAPPLPHAHSAASPRVSSSESRWWKHEGPSGGGWGLGRSWSSSAVGHPRAEVNGGVGDNAPSGAGSGGGGDGKVWWLGYRRGISADYDIGDLVGRGRTGEVRRATARKGAWKGRRGKAGERGPPVVVKTICKAEVRGAAWGGSAGETF